MSRVLFVKGHPLTTEESDTVKGLEAFRIAYEKMHPQDEIDFIDVFEADIPEIDKDMMRGWNAMYKGEKFENLTFIQRKKLKRFDELTQQFLAADKIVIANPLWNMFMPSSLKTWLDCLFKAGTTFTYTEEGSLGLVSGKKVLHIQTSGGIFQGQDTSSKWIREIFTFIGITDIQQVRLEGHAVDPVLTEKLNKEFIENLVKTAITF